MPQALFLQRWNVLCRRASFFPPQRFAQQTRFIAGQPTPETHPEILSNGEIMPGISAMEFELRRQILLASLPKDSIAIIGSSTVKKMTDVVPYPYRQNANYLYFIGCQQPGGVAVMNDRDFCMFMPDLDPEKAIWDGLVAGTAAAFSLFQATQAYSVKDISKHLPSLIRKAKRLYCDKNFLEAFGQVSRVQEAMKQKEVHHLEGYCDQVRWVKSPSEINLMRHSTNIISQAFVRTMQISSFWPHEHVLAATVEYECKIRGAQRMAFPPVVGGGANGSTIHYSRNDRPVREGELVLMDAGCEFYGYVSDVTRTWAPHGSFSQAQKEVYELVLKAQNECIASCYPGITLCELHRHASKVLFEGVVKLGISDTFEEYSRLNPTSVGHYLGLDVHDCSSISNGKPLEPGVIITIEPGLYIPAEETIPIKYRGIGIRIEDDVLITNAGNEVLTSSIPKNLNEVESSPQCSLDLQHPLSFIHSNHSAC